MPRSIEDIIASADDLAARFEHYEPQPADRLDVAAFIALRAAAEQRAHSERDVVHAVIDCRQAGYSWNMIGALLGTSGEAARQRYSKLVPA